MLRGQKQSPEGERSDLRGQGWRVKLVEFEEARRILGRAPVIVRVLIALVILALTTAISVPTVRAVQGVKHMGKTPPTYLTPDDARLPPCSTGATPCVVR